jgi:AcrR family transcriptional regulator
LDVSSGLFADRGFAGVTMQDIAEGTGVTKPVVYQHFTSKRSLFIHVLDAVGEEMVASIRGATQSASAPRKRVEAGLAAYFDFVACNFDSFTLLFGDESRRIERRNGAVNRVEHEIAALISPLIDADLESGHRLFLAHAVIGLAEGASRHWVAEGMQEPPAVAAQRVADVAWAGLRAIHR